MKEVKSKTWRQAEIGVHLRKQKEGFRNAIREPRNMVGDELGCGASTALGSLSLSFRAPWRKRKTRQMMEGDLPALHTLALLFSGRVTQVGR